MANAKTRRLKEAFTVLAWETEVWIAQDPTHMIHFNGERFLGPYGDIAEQTSP